MDLANHFYSLSSSSLSTVDCIGFKKIIFFSQLCNDYFCIRFHATFNWINVFFFDAIFICHVQRPSNTALEVDQ